MRSTADLARPFSHLYVASITSTDRSTPSRRQMRLGLFLQGAGHYVAGWRHPDAESGPWRGDINATTPPARERLQSPAGCDQFDGLYGCIPCACCSKSSELLAEPGQGRRPGLAAAAFRFIADSRDLATAERLDDLEDPYRLFRCRRIMNCTYVCPKGLKPTKAISEIRTMLVKRTV
jgi:hypothetical protein